MKPEESYYYPPQAMPSVYCGACLIVVLTQSKQAAALFDKVVEMYRLPDLVTVANRILRRLPEGEVLYKQISKDFEETVMKKSKDTFFGRLSKRAMKYSFALNDMMGLNKIFSRDFRMWAGTINELIKVGFNNEADQKNGIYKVTARTSPLLFGMIHIRAFAKFNGIELIDEENQEAIKVAGETYDLTKQLITKPNSKRKRAETKRMKKMGMERHTFESICKKAVFWYESRVAYPSTTAFCKAMSFKGKDYEPSNVSNLVKECDLALGYPRSR